MKKILGILLFSAFLFNLSADQWDGFFKKTGFPRKVIDDGSVVKGKLYQATISYQISNKDGKKGNFENDDSAKVIIKNQNGKSLSTDKFMTGTELRTWGRENMMLIITLILGDKPQLDKDTINELMSLASVALLNKNIE